MAGYFIKICLDGIHHNNNAKDAYYNFIVKQSLSQDKQKNALRFRKTPK